MIVTQTKPEFLTEALIEVLNNEWKVNAIESGRSLYHQLEIEVCPVSYTHLRAHET